MPRSRAKPWTEAEVATLTRVYAAEGMLAAREALPDRYWNSLQRKVRELGLPMPIVGPADAPALAGELLEEAIRLHEGGMGFAAIGARVGFPDTTVSNIVLIAMCARRGFTPAERDERGWLTEAGKARLHAMLQEGRAMKDIQLELGVNASMAAGYRRQKTARAITAPIRDAKLPGRAGIGKRARQLRQDERVAITAMLREGWADRHVWLTLNVPLRSVQAIRLMLDEAGELPALCPCGKRRGHQGQHAGQAVMNLSDERRRAIEEQLRQGFNSSAVSRATGVPDTNVRLIAAVLDARGELPVKCACGAHRGHSGACRDRELLDDIRKRVRRGESSVEIGAALDRHPDVILSYLRYLKAAGVSLGTCKCGQPNGHPNGCVANSPHQLSSQAITAIQRMVRRRLSANEIRRRTGRSTLTVLKYATPVWEAMFAEGVACGCGKRLGHQSLCAETYETGERRRGVTPVEPKFHRRITRLLLDGVNAVNIRRDLDVSQQTVLLVLADLTPAQRSERLSILRRRPDARRDAARGAEVLAAIKRIVPAGIDGSIRDEVIAELCLAVMQGDLTLAGIKEHCDAYVGRAFSQWASAFGPRSLNEGVGEDGDTELLELFGDATGAELIDEFEIGGAS